MAGASKQHNRLLTNLVRLSANHLLERPRSVHANAMKAKTEKVDKYTCPDIVITCAAEKFEDEKAAVLLNPPVVMAILSAATEADDRGKKFAHYQFIDSFVEYALVSQDACRIEKFVRQQNNKWLYQQFNKIDDSIAVESIDCKLPLNAIYRRLEPEA